MQKQLFYDEAVSEINKQFVIRYYPNPSNYSRLIGAGQYHHLVGWELRNKHFKKVLQGKEYVYTFKFRRGLKIVFHSK